MRRGNQRKQDQGYGGVGHRLTFTPTPGINVAMFLLTVSNSGKLQLRPVKAVKRKWFGLRLLLDTGEWVWRWRVEVI